MAFGLEDSLRLLRAGGGRSHNVLRRRWGQRQYRCILSLQRNQKLLDWWMLLHLGFHGGAEAWTIVFLLLGSLVVLTILSCRELLDLLTPRQLHQ